MLRHTREDMSIPGNVSIVNMLDEIIWIFQWFRKFGNTNGNRWWCRRFREQKELIKVRAKSHWINTYTLLFDESKTKCLDGGTCPMSMTNHAVGIGTCTQCMTIPSDLFFGDACAKNPWPNEISAGSWISGQKFAQRLEIKGKGQNSYTERKIGQFGLVHEETIAVFYTRMPRDAVRLCGKKWETQGSLTWNKHLLQHRQWKTDWREKLKQFKGQSCNWSRKIPCLWMARWIRSSCYYLHHPVCRGYKSGNRCICGIRSLYRHADGEK